MNIFEGYNYENIIKLLKNNEVFESKRNKHNRRVGGVIL